jgi:hypothetical protein
MLFLYKTFVEENRKKGERWDGMHSLTKVGRDARGRGWHVLQISCQLSL